MSGQLHTLFHHLAWADARLLQALENTASPPPEAIREYGHALGADEVWLARLLGRPPRIAVWPDLTPAELPGVAAMIHAGYRQYLDALDDAALGRIVGYTNSAGASFTNAAGDILLHVAMHAQYHRGKINLLLRQAGAEPAPTDFIAFVRGVPAASTRVPLSPPGVGRPPL
jgi:uncharacterized damage-inducible protein DinB